MKERNILAQVYTGEYNDEFSVKCDAGSCRVATQGERLCAKPFIILFAIKAEQRFNQEMSFHHRGLCLCFWTFWSLHCFIMHKGVMTQNSCGMKGTFIGIFRAGF